MAPQQRPSESSCGVARRWPTLVGRGGGAALTPKQLVAALGSEGQAAGAMIAAYAYDSCRGSSSLGGKSRPEVGPAVAS